MLSFFRKFFLIDPLRPFWKQVEEINSLEEEIQRLNDSQLKEESANLKKLVESGVSFDKILPRAFALVREASKRTLGQRQYDVQLLGGIVIHKGAIAEMVTGEGKTLAAVAPAYLNSLSGKGVHIVTVNEYLARRDAVWMGQIYHSLGLSVSCLVPNGAFLYDPEWKVEKENKEKIDEERDIMGSYLVKQDFLRPVSRREAYLADITYGTNHEFGFDYLRDNLAYSLNNQVQREHNFAIIDEIDSILIDEARTPLIISAPDAQSSEYYKTFARIVSRLNKDEDYTVDEKYKSVSITDKGIDKVEKMLGIKNIYDIRNVRLIHYLEESLKAKALFHRDKDYVVKNGEVLIVDEFTGRILFGRRYSGGLHQAIEAKEGVNVKEESRTYAKISVQNYFRMYNKLSGMTGTAQTSAEEFYKVYNLDVYTIPTNKPLIRKSLNDLIYKSGQSKWKAVVNEIKERHKKGQPILVGTTSIEKNELLSSLLAKENIKHEVLNAKNNEREGAIIAQAGRLGAVTVATNMAGRGVDIILGGNPPNREEAEKVKKLGGLHVIGTERHEARRIDNQLRGRAGRQGDPGSSQFFLSLEDDLLRIFGGDRIKNLMERFDLPSDQPLNFSFLNKAVAQAQARIEGLNFDLRKHLLDYDDILNKQRISVYRKRQEILESVNSGKLPEMIYGFSEEYLDAVLSQKKLVAGALESGESEVDLKKLFEEAKISTENRPYPESGEEKELKDLLSKRSVEISMDPETPLRILGILDMLWMEHLENLEALMESVRLRAYGQKDPLVEYRREAHSLFKNFWNNFNAQVFMNAFRLAKNLTASIDRTKAGKKTGILSLEEKPMPSINKKIGRNDPCPCGSGKKYKYCHGKNL